MTGLGAVTPIGNDVPATWQAAVEGRSGVDFIRSFDASGYPVRIAAEVKEFDPASVVDAKEARRLSRNVLLSLAAAREAVADAALDGAYAVDRVGVIFGTAIGGVISIVEQHNAFLERGTRTACRPTSSPTASSTRRAASSRSRSATAGSTSRPSPPARPARPRSARPPRS